MIEAPTINYQSGHSLTILDHRLHHPMGRWRFWGGLLIALAVLGMILFPEQRSTEPAALLLPVITAATGTVLLVAAGKGEVKAVALAHLDHNVGVLEVFSSASSLLEGQDLEIWLEEIQDVLFGMTLWHRETNARDKSRAFSVCVRLYNGSIIPIIEATAGAEVAFRIARTLSDNVGVPIHQTGMGA